MALPVSPPPVGTAPVGTDKNFVSAWAQLFTNWFTTLRFPAGSNAPPATSAGIVPLGGGLAYDQNFLYVSVGKNQWKRIPLNAF